MLVQTLYCLKYHLAEIFILVSQEIVILLHFYMLLLIMEL